MLLIVIVVVARKSFSLSYISTRGVCVCMYIHRVSSPTNLPTPQPSPPPTLKPTFVPTNVPTVHPTDHPTEVSLELLAERPLFSFLSNEQNICLTVTTK